VFLPSCAFAVCIRFSITMNPDAVAANASTTFDRTMQAFFSYINMVKNVGFDRFTRSH
jgi:hypothetical protein